MGDNEQRIARARLGDLKEKAVGKMDRSTVQRHERKWVTEERVGPMWDKLQ